jgi:hypothetical protein
MALYNYLRNSQANDTEKPFAAYDPNGMKFYFEQSDNAFSFSSVTNAGGKARLIISLASPTFPAVGDSVTITGTLAGTYKVIDVQSDPDTPPQYITIDLPFTATSSGTGKGIFTNWIWGIEVADTSLGTYRRVSDFKIRPDNQGRFTVDITAFIQSAFPPLYNIAYDDVTKELPGMFLFFKIIDSAGNSAYSGYRLVLRACEWFVISDIEPDTNPVFRSEARYFMRRGEDDLLIMKFSPEDEKAVWDSDIVVGTANSAPINYNYCDQFPAYSLAWLNRAGFIQQFTFSGVPVEKWRDGDEVVAMDSSMTEYSTKVTGNYDAVEVSTGIISFEMYQAIIGIRKALQVWDVSNTFFYKLPVILDRSNFVVLDHGAQRFEIKFEFRYAQQKTVARQ